MLFCLPFVAVAALFLRFEKYNYFFLRKDELNYSRPISAMRETEMIRPTKILLGDSRFEVLDTDYIEELTGERYTNLAFGGASIPESVQLFWFAAERCELQKVVFCVSFYTINWTYGDDRRVIKAMEYATEPEKYIYNLKNWMATYDAVKSYVETGVDPTVYVDPTAQRPSVIMDNTPGVYREDLLDYTRSIQIMCSAYGISQTSMTALLDIVDYCEQNDIELTLVFPPAQQVIWDNVIYAYALDQRVAGYKELLKQYADCIDMEWESDFSRDQNNFRDGFHMYPTGPQQLFTRAIFTDGEFEFSRRSKAAEVQADIQNRLLARFEFAAEE